MVSQAAAPCLLMLTAALVLQLNALVEAVPEPSNLFTEPVVARVNENVTMKTRRRRNLQGAMISKTAEEFGRYRITEWYSTYNDQGECSGETFVLPEPIHLDPTGRTCYVNPIRDKEILKGSVFWFAPIPEPAEDSDLYGGAVYSWFVTLNHKRGFPSWTEFFPGPCNETTGECECGNFEAVRQGWNIPSDSPTNFCDDNIALYYSCDVEKPLVNAGACTVYMTSEAQNSTGQVFAKFGLLTAKLDQVDYDRPTPTPIVGDADGDGVPDGTDGVDGGGGTTDNSDGADAGNGGGTDGGTTAGGGGSSAAAAGESYNTQGLLQQLLTLLLLVF